MQFDSKLKIGAIIKDFRKRNGYTQEQLAELIEVTPGFLGQVERDETYPNIECFLQDLFGQSCKTFLDIVACPNWTKLQSAG